MQEPGNQHQQQKLHLSNLAWAKPEATSKQIHLGFAPAIFRVRSGEVMRSAILAYAAPKCPPEKPYSPDAAALAKDRGTACLGQPINPAPDPADLHEKM